MTSSILIKHGFVATMEGEELIKDGAVLVSDGVISAVGKTEELAGQKAEHVIEASGKIVVPGFINAHTHTGGDTFLRSAMPDAPGYKDFIDFLKRFKWPLLMKMSTKDFYLSGLLGYLENIRSGATTLIDNHYGPRGVNTDGVAEAAVESGLRSVLVKGYHDFPYLMPEEFMEPTEKLPEMYGDIYRRWQGKANGRIRVAIGPINLLYCTPESIKALTSLSRDLNIPIHTHVAEVKRGCDVIKERYGKGYVDVFQDLGAISPRFQAAHGIWLSDDEIETLARGGATVIHNPANNLVLTAGVCRVPALMKAGVNVALGTDGNLDMLYAMKLVASFQKVVNMDPNAMDARRALRMATINGAKALGLEKELGSLKVGKKADITIVNLMKPHIAPVYDPIIPLVYFAQSSDVETVISDGKIVMENGKVKTVDEEKLVHQAQKRAEELKSTI